MLGTSNAILCCGTCEAAGSPYEQFDVTKKQKLVTAAATSLSSLFISSNAFSVETSSILDVFGFSCSVMGNM